ncbi:MAG: TRAP transporter substrate-binding protein DctP [Rhodospirillaceae bacterium]
MSSNLKTAIGISALAGMLAVAAPATSKTINITVAAAPPPAVTFVGTFKDQVSEKINERLKAEGHDLQINWNHAYAQTLAKFTEIFESVEDGIAGAGLILKNFEPANLPLEAYVVHVPFLKLSERELVEVDSRMRELVPEMNQAYERHNQVFIASGVNDSQQLFTTFPVTKVEDLQGRKLGSSGSFGEWLRGTGATIVNANMASSYTDIKNGIFDGYPLSQLLSFVYKTWQAAPYYTKVYFGPSVTSGMTFNTETWKSLPDYAQKIIREEAGKWVDYQLEIDGEKAKKAEAVMIKGEVKFHTLADEERKKWAMAMPNIAKEWAARQDEKGLPGTKLLTVYLAELRARNIELIRDWDKD